MCTYYVTGKCNLGRSCQFQHGQPGPEVAPASRGRSLDQGLPRSRDKEQPRPPRQGCLEFQRSGTCVSGDRCQFVHSAWVAPADGPVQRASVTPGAASPQGQVNRMWPTTPPSSQQRLPNQPMTPQPPQSPAQYQQRRHPSADSRSLSADRRRAPSTGPPPASPLAGSTPRMWPTSGASQSGSPGAARACATLNATRGGSPSD